MPDALGSSYRSQKHVYDALKQILVLQNLIKHSLLGNNKNEASEASDNEETRTTASEPQSQESSNKTRENRVEGIFTNIKPCSS